MSNEETNNETDLLAILGGVRPRLCEVQFVNLCEVLTFDEYKAVREKLKRNFLEGCEDVFSLHNSQEMLSYLEAAYETNSQSSDYSMAVCRIRAIICLMGDSVRINFASR